MSLLRREPADPRIESLEEALTVVRNSKDPIKRREAFRYLGDPGNYGRFGGDQLRSESSELLALAVTSEMDSYTQVEIIRGLRFLQEPSTAAALHEVARTGDSKVQGAACEALAVFPSQTTAEILTEQLTTSGDLDVRLSAAKSLAAMPREYAVDVLIASLEDANVAVQYRSQESLKELLGADHGIDPGAWEREYEVARQGHETDSQTRRSWLR